MTFNLDNDSFEGVVTHDIGARSYIGSRNLATFVMGIY